MENKALAKTKDEETIIGHTEKLLDNYNTLKKCYPNIKNLDWELLELACIYHDMGKLNTKFQNKLMEKLKYPLLKDELEDIFEIPHGYLSSAFLNLEELQEKYGLDGLKILCQSIFYHHNREKPDNMDNIKRTINEDLSKYINEFYYERIGKVEQLTTKYWKYVKRRLPDSDEYDSETNKKFIMTKGLLNKIDYAASSGVPIEYRNDELEERTYEFFNNMKSEPNKLQKFMKESRDNSVIAIASTGIGKTEGALLWIGNNKGFFTLPLRVSLNAIYDRLKEKIKFDNEKLGLLHSESATEYMKRSEGHIDKEHLDETKQLSKALTVCTLDQLLDFVFKFEGFELKLATLSYSKLVIDEIQMYSSDMLAYLLAALKEITDMGGKFAIVTATFPPVLKSFMEYLKIYYKEAEEPFLKENKNGQIFERHRMKVLDEKINIEHIKHNYKNKRILVIVNTVKEAQRLYDELLEENISNVNIFHSKYIKKDRSKIEKKILEAGEVIDGIPKNPSQTIWITTQIVEASLDIDFDVLYTELSDLAGLFQRMGRVYRNRELDDTTNVYVYTGGNSAPSGITKSKKSIIDYDIYSASRGAIEEFGDGEIKEIDKMNLINKYFTYERLGNSNFYRDVKEKINYINNLKCFEVQKSEVKLRDILTVTIIPKVVFEENFESINENIRLYSSDDSSYSERIKSRDYILSYTVAIPQYEYEFACSKGLIFDTLKIGKFEEIKVVSFPYDEKGLQKPKNEDANDIECLFV
ncbi:CRISPR-associated helicase/endonuclease Cas3 [Clostridium beijerinckii]|uniref:CRISPR-associated helicase/endonuclease Cas3 n=1 Tax=Clostridium beijerinckii TaxID=1520 RepID=UPI00098C5F01|nr:CRISPR-associated helicase/endonuclease Cas3 [Clostridium beijerinckii]NRT80306.1 CRISPR-associated endonuclease/helicase Cas3 [Clostridium beijerinckii]OOM45179.1 CRISPR-associated nuclease/helicase Cas3 [Clostridium beijerinckii]